MSGKQRKMRTFRDRLAEDLKDPVFLESFEQERLALQIASKITLLREAIGLTQQDLADRMGTSQQTVSRLESGEYEGFTLKTLEKLAEATCTRLKIDFLPIHALKEKDRRSGLA